MEDLHKQVINLQFKVRDLMDEPNHPAARRLNTEIQALEDELQVKKNPRTVAPRVQRIMGILQGDAKAARIMNYEHLELLRKQFEQIWHQLQRMR